MVNKLIKKLAVVSLIGMFVFPSISLAATTNYGVGNGDGFTGNSGAVWATVHDAATGNDANTALTYINVQGDRLNAGTYYIYRGYLPTDTSGIGAGATVTSAVLHLFLTAAQTTGTSVFSAVTTTQASNTALATTDFSSVGATSLCTFSVVSTDAAGTGYTCTINDLTVINKTGFTKIGIREDQHDRANVAATNDRYTLFESSESATAGLRPYIAVTTSSATDNGLTQMMGMDF